MLEVDFSLFDRVEATSSTNEKQDILAGAGYVEQLLLKLALESNINFRLKKIPAFEAPGPGVEVDEFLNLADELSSKKGLTKKDKEGVFDFLKRCNADQQKWFTRILKQELQCGIDAKTVNTVFPDLVDLFEVPLADTYDSETHEQGIPDRWIDVKIDGFRALSFTVLVDADKSTQIISRGGKPYLNFPQVEKELMMLPPGIYDGELYLHCKNSFQELSQYVRREEVAPDELPFRYYLYDMTIPDDWDKPSIPYEDRRAMLTEILMDVFGVPHIENPFVLHFGERLGLTTIHRANNFAEMDELLEQSLALGYEGLMLKDPQSLFERKRCSNVLKVKEFKDGDAVITGVYEGKKGKTLGSLGGVYVEWGEGDSKVNFKVGSGFSDELRREIWANPQTVIGKTIEFKYHILSKTGIPRHGTFKRFRWDKDPQ